MEGLEPGPEAEAIVRRFIEGELSHEEYHVEMRRLALDIARDGSLILTPILEPTSSRIPGISKVRRGVLK
jgi:hypothetical protein